MKKHVDNKNIVCYYNLIKNISDKYYLSSSLLCVWRIQDKVETREGNI